MELLIIYIIKVLVILKIDNFKIKHKCSLELMILNKTTIQKIQINK